MKAPVASYEPGGGGASIEWFSVQADGTRVLLDVEGIGESSARLDSGAAPEVGVTVRVSPRPAAVALLTTPG